MGGVGSTYLESETYPEWPKKQMSPDEKSELTTQKLKLFAKK